MGLCFALFNNEVNEVQNEFGPAVFLQRFVFELFGGGPINSLHFAEWMEEDPFALQHSSPKVQDLFTRIDKEKEEQEIRAKAPYKVCLVIRKLSC